MSTRNKYNSQKHPLLSSNTTIYTPAPARTPHEPSSSLPSLEIYQHLPGAAWHYPAALCFCAAPPWGHLQKSEKVILEAHLVDVLKSGIKRWFRRNSADNPNPESSFNYPASTRPSSYCIRYGIFKSISPFMTLYEYVGHQLSRSHSPVSTTYQLSVSTTYSQLDYVRTRNKAQGMLREWSTNVTIQLGSGSA